MHLREAPVKRPVRSGARAALPLLATLILILAGCRAAQTGASPSPTAPAETGSPTEAPMTTPTEEPTQEPMADAVVVVAESDLGPILTDGEGRTLYLFTNDDADQSSCTDSCAQNWPPLTVESEGELVAGEGVEGELGTITRDDGSLQVTIDGVPLYYFAGDSAPGDLNGQEVGGVWFAVAPDGQQAGSSSDDDFYDY